MRIPDYTVSKFTGLNTFIKDTKTLKAGVATDELNWLTAKYGDHIELRRGKLLLGKTRTTGSGKVTGMGVGIRYDGTQIVFRAHGKQVKYYDTESDDWIEVVDARTGDGDILGDAADGEDVWFSPLQNLAGSFMAFGSPSSGIFLVHVASPGHAVNQNVTDFRFGVLRFGQGRAIAGQRNGTTAGNNDKTGLYLSYIDKALLSGFTQTTGEAFDTGDGTLDTFTHTLTAVTGVKTAMYPSVTDGVETFTDDRNGLMVGNLGGTGTINYATGEVSVTFATPPILSAAITCTYYTQDATDSGPLDFSTDSTGTGKAKIYRQDDGGGNLMAVFPFLNVEYCFHPLKTWALTTSLDDTESTNLPYRNVGIKYPRSAAETPDGVLFADTSKPTEPKIRRLEIAQNTNNLTIVPAPLSDSLDLSPHAFDYAVVTRFGDYELVSVQDYVNAVANGYNSTTYVRHVYSKAWDRLDYPASCFAEYNGTLLAGDPISDNVYVLFSGFDEDEAAIENRWQDGQLDLGADRLKVAHHMRVTGLIQKDQSIAVYLILDDGPPVLSFTIEGSGSYVDPGVNTSIGSYTLGTKVIGGGGSASAHPFDVTFPIHTDRFHNISVMFVARGIGWAEIDSYTYKDIRDKGSRSLPIKSVS